MTATDRQQRPASTPRRLLGRVTWLALLWLGLNGGDHRSWIVGAPVIAIAAALSVWVFPDSRWRLSPPGALAFLAYFI